MVASVPLTGTQAAATPVAGAASAPVLELTGLSFARASVRVLDGVSLRVDAGECVAVFGPTGAGKTTLLRLIAGLLEPASGTVRIGGREVSRSGAMAAPHLRGVAMVFQGLALWPHLTAFEHAFEAARARGIGDAAARGEANAALAAVALPALAGERPGRLSGGEQQRLAVARALAARPRLLLLDEPFANIDRPTRDGVLRALDDYRRESGAGLLWVTHDVHEGLEGSGRVAVLRGGRLEQVGPPERVHAAPVSRFMAACVGFTSFVPATRVSDGECATAWGRFPVRGGADAPALESADAEGFLALRPGALRRDDTSPVRGTVAACGFRDGAWLLRVQAGGAELACPSPGPVEPGALVGVRIDGPGVFVLP